MKISIIMGRGIEGCGVSKWVKEYSSWLKANGHTAVVWASKDKKWNRRDSFDTSSWNEVLFKKSDEISKIITDCNTSDLVFIASLPPKSHTAEAQSNFNNLLQQIKTEVVMIQHDHNIHSIRRNSCLDETINRAEYIFTFSTENDFAKYAKPTINLTSLFGIKKEVTGGFQPGLDFDAIRNKYWKDINDTSSDVHRFIGRTTSWKGINEMNIFYHQYLHSLNHTVLMEGIERSVGYVAYKAEYPHTYSNKVIEDYNFSKKPNDIIVFGPFNNDRMLERMSRSTFGYQLTMIKPEFINRFIEYTHCEIVACGTIPVFRKSFGDACTHRVYGKPLTECDNSGTIWFDDNNMSVTFEQIKKVAGDTKLRDEMRQEAYEFYKLHQDSSFIFPAIHEKITELKQSL